ncbi:hypothetical protein FSP39_008816 [Pinctada imbricata]|uniref:TNF receptor-associated factor n=1 Tax=Pinctada imbricata TaxID=66713 RepID=A0AA88XLJ2_PINIB|nr:hypothetical protein FSP39_008816 [Pinctada imbricata]
MEATCLNQGCNWSGKFRHFEKHANECKFKPVTCQQCHGLVEASRYKHHLGNDCPKRPIKCQYCKEDFYAEIYEAHKLECPKFPVKCDDCGKKKLTRDMLQHHYNNECSQRKITCPAGCDPVERSRFLTHLDQKSGFHLNFIMDQLKILTQETNTKVGQLAPMSEILQLKQNVEQLQVRLQQVGGPIPPGSEDNAVMQQRCRALELKVSTFEGIVTTLHREIERCLTHLDGIERGNSGNSGPVAQRVEQLERALAQKDKENMELKQYIDDKLSATYDGEHVWRIENWSKLRKDAMSGMRTSIFSVPFYTSRHGYKMCVRLYPNGDGMGRGTHISVFFVVMMGDYDPVLKWPFKHRVTFRLVNQNNDEQDQTDSFRPDPNSSSFKKPTSEMNIASGCPLFIPLTKINDASSGFVTNDVLFLKTTVTLNS